MRLCSLAQTVSTLLFLCINHVQAQTAIPAETSGANNPFVWDSMEKSAELSAMTNLTHFSFWVTNTSSAEATILKTETSCDCTVAEAGSKLPWQFKPGESGLLKVNMNTLGKFGLVTKTVTVHSSAGSQVLTLHVKIPLSPAPFNTSVRKQDMMAAQADRQSVFRGSCASCHNWPTLNLTGEALFKRACCICHTSQHRAEMVPDLAALKHSTDAAYWRNWVTHGKENSLMPAFAKWEGGILDTNQIDSLVEFLQQKYSANVTTTISGSAAAQAESTTH